MEGRKTLVCFWRKLVKLFTHSNQPWKNSASLPTNPQQNEWRPERGWNTVSKFQFYKGRNSPSNQCDYIGRKTVGGRNGSRTFEELVYQLREGRVKTFSFYEYVQ